MKKEFKAPIVETKELHTVNNVMLDLSISGGQASASANTLTDDGKVNADFKQWKGFNK